MNKTLTFESEFPAPADWVWHRAKKPATFFFVIGNFLRFSIRGEIPEVFNVVESSEGRLWLFGILPLPGLHHLTLESLDDSGRTFQSREWSGMLRRWDHRISVQPLGDDRCLYQDRLEIEAGPLTFLVAAFAKIFFNYRHRRWKKFIRLNYL